MIRHCPICQHIGPKILHHVSLELPQPHPLCASFNVAACRACRFGYADNTASQDVYDSYYAELSRYTDGAIGGGTTGYDRERCKNIAAVIAEGMPYRYARVLDIGCANGGLLSQLKALGYYNLTGLDPSPECAKNAIDLHSINGITNNIFSEKRLNGRMHLIILSHVIEHIVDVHRIVPAVLEMLADDGLVYAEVPDARQYPEMILGPLNEFNIEHINYFSLEHLQLLFARGGMEMVSGGTRRTPAPQGQTYPVAYGFFRRASNVVPVVAESMEGALTEYVRVSGEWMERLNTQLFHDMLGTKSIAIWGAGQLLFKLLKMFPLQNHVISQIVDSNPVNWGKTLRGVEIVRPDMLDDDAVVLISTLNHNAEIRAQLGGRRAIELAARNVEDNGWEINPEL